MKVLILSCDTGEGHNSAGRAVKEFVEKQGDQAVMLDMMLLKGKRVSRAVSQTYINVVKGVPGLFGFVYKLGGLISSPKRKSPVYFACALVAKSLRRYLEENDFDVIVTPHLYPAETLTYMKRKGWLAQSVVAVCTDYTCIPFWEETDCDYYVIPHEDLRGEFTDRGIPQEKLLPWGIPVRLAFLERPDRVQARKNLGLAMDHRIYLVMGGSMGFGMIQIFVLELARRLMEKEEIIVICGNNQKLKDRLAQELGGRESVKILGYTDQVADYMAACDVIFTKPGGLSSTEAAVRHIPIVHTKPIPGCENRNLEFFQSRGMSVGRRSFFGQVKAGRKLLEKEKLRQDMIQAQERNVKPDSVNKIYGLLRELAQLQG
ncbi:MGDG synthase family glycosyltransferase [Candidatus Acetatifactor stercoripullorum]|uniref:MGDG synthase family glycosyltransferase n=1 Tax=Candidatus Acetatifactor stercoripullorum TaxID=2838414 RepID=UPI00298DBB78|nr:glycosyltransferase [Candidatus Acetatifactor stercoripullorum]